MTKKTKLNGDIGWVCVEINDESKHDYLIRDCYTTYEGALASVDYEDYVVKIAHLSLVNGVIVDTTDKQERAL